MLSFWMQRLVPSCAKKLCRMRQVLLAHQAELLFRPNRGELEGTRSNLNWDQHLVRLA